MRRMIVVGVLLVVALGGLTATYLFAQDNGPFARPPTAAAGKSIRVRFFNNSANQRFVKVVLTEPGTAATTHSYDNQGSPIGAQDYVVDCKDLADTIAFSKVEFYLNDPADLANPNTPVLIAELTWSAQASTAAAEVFFWLDDSAIPHRIVTYGPQDPAATANKSDLKRRP